MRYEKTEAQKKAEEALRRYSEQKPAAYSSQWESKRQEAADALAQRKAFSYDVNSDALYQQLKDQYVRQGRLAMMDTMGRAAALTGGYGNSYGQVAGQQTYQQYLQQLGDRVPELQNMALQRYNAESQRLSDRYALYGELENREYDRYTDALNAYYQELDRLEEEARYQQQLGYEAYRDQLADRRADEEFAYQQQRDQEADRQWQAEFDENLRRYTLENEPQQSRQSQQSRQTGTEPELSEAGKAFLKDLPYAHAGSSVAAWKKLVAQRLQAAQSAGKLTSTDAQLLAAQLKLYE